MTAVAEKPVQEVVSESDTPIYDDLVNGLGDPKDVQPFEPFVLPEDQVVDPESFRDLYLTQGVEPVYPSPLTFPPTAVLLASCEEAGCAAMAAALVAFGQGSTRAEPEGPYQSKLFDLPDHMEGSLAPGRTPAGVAAILEVSEGAELAQRQKEDAFWRASYQVPLELPAPTGPATVVFTPVWDSDEEIK